MSAAGLSIVVAAAETVIGRFHQTALDVIAGPGGVLVLALGVLGLAVLVLDAALIGVRTVRRFLARRRPSNPAARARGLASLGAAPAEIARATGLPRDALLLVAPDALVPRTKVPTTAESSAPSAPAARPASTTLATEAIATTKVAAARAVAPKRARPLPHSRAGNANAPSFGEAA
jgi:hypothetical protein